MNKINVILLAFLLSFMGAGIASGQSEATGWKYQIGTTGFGTLCYPASVPFYRQVEGEEKPQGFRAFTVSGMQGDKLVLVEIPPLDENGNSNSIREYTPVIVYGEPGDTVTFECGELKKYTQRETCTTDNNLLVGTTQDQGITIHGDNLYIMQNHNGKLAFYCCNGTVKDDNGNDQNIEYTVAQFRCYLELPKKSASAASLSFSVPENDSSASGISSPEIATTPMSDGIYSLSGVRVDNPKSGEVYVMVIGGRAVKMIIK